MVPGSTLMYGSSFTIETFILRDSRIAAREAAAIPLPREETTPPVTNTYLVMARPRAGNSYFTGKCPAGVVAAFAFSELRLFVCRRRVIGGDGCSNEFAGTVLRR